MPSADQIVVGGTGKVYAAVVGSTAPTNATTALPAAWIDLGYISEEGVTATFGKETETIQAWQSLYPVRRVVTSASAMVKFNLQQWNLTTVPFALGGGTVSEPTAGIFKYVPADPATIDERALVVEWTDGSRHYRLYFPKGMVVDAVETNITRTASSELPITYEATPTSGTNAFNLFTDDTALDPTP